MMILRMGAPRSTNLAEKRRGLLRIHLFQKKNARAPYGASDLQNKLWMV